MDLSIIKPYQGVKPTVMGLLARGGTTADLSVEIFLSSPDRKDRDVHDGTPQRSGDKTLGVLTSVQGNAQRGRTAEPWPAEQTQVFAEELLNVNWFV